MSHDWRWSVSLWIENSKWLKSSKYVRLLICRQNYRQQLGVGWWVGGRHMTGVRLLEAPEAATPPPPPPAVLSSTTEASNHCAVDFSAVHSTVCPAFYSAVCCPFLLSTVTLYINQPLLRRGRGTVLLSIHIYCPSAFTT